MEAKEFRTHLKNELIPFWNQLKDEEHGGFYGYADHLGNPDPSADKGCILNSRILWFYSSAYRLLDDPSLLEMAHHAYRFLKDHFLDSQYGGVYWSVHYDGSVADDTKHTYNQAFAIYGLAAYYIASGRKSAMDLAYNLYHLIEEKCRDKNGYLEAFHRDFSPASNEKLSENGVLAERTMNTLLHVMEAYSELYRADDFRESNSEDNDFQDNVSKENASQEVGNSIRTILELFKDKIYNGNRMICDVFFDLDYHSLIDLESYGHDIEASWLVGRACEVLNDPAYREKMAPVISGLAKGAYENSIDTNVYAMNTEAENGRVDAQKIWWVQAEAVTGFYNAYQEDPAKAEYREIAEKIWRYIQDHVIDKNSGEWIESIPENGTPDEKQALAHAWKCPYHNGRMYMEMIERLSR